MAKIQVDGCGIIEVDDSFVQLPPAEQQKVVDQIKVECQKGSTGSAPVPNQEPVGGAEDISARPGDQPTPEQQAQIDGLVKRGVPEEEARASVMGQESFYSSDKQMFEGRSIIEAILGDQASEAERVETLWNDLTKEQQDALKNTGGCLLYTSPSPRDS